MKRSILSFLILIAGILVLGLSGCTKVEEEDLTDWAIPRFEKKVYVVKKGDSISAIAEQHGVSPRLLSKVNNLGLEGTKSIIYSGQKLIIPDVNKTIYYYEK